MQQVSKTQPNNKHQRGLETQQRSSSQPSELQVSKNRFSGALRRLFFVVFAVVFGLLFVQVVFNNMHFSYNPLWVLPLALLWGGLFALLYWLTNRFAAFLGRREMVCLAVFFLLLMVTQLFFYSQLAAYPTMDFERVFTGAVNYSVNGFIEEPYLDYFYKYPNNMPLTILLQFFFRAANRLGFTDFYRVGALVNAGSIALTYGFVYLCCRRMFGVSRGFFALLLLYICLPLQCYISIFYTDTLTLPFAPFALYLYLRMRSAANWKGIVAAAAILAGGMALGVTLKYSVVLTLVAIGFDLALRLDFKRLLLTAGLFIALFAACSGLFHSFMYANFLDRTLAEDRATPFNAWIMMGLKGDGAHNPEDNYLIWNWPTAEEKKQHASEEIRNRLAAFTPLELAAFLNQKALRSFGSGNLDATRTVADSPMAQTFLVECISPSGRYYEPFDTLMQGYHVALFGLIIAGAVLAAKNKSYAAFVPYLTIFGLFLFLLLWEAGQRYLLNYFGMYIVAATFSATALHKTLAAPFAARRGRRAERSKDS